MSILSEPLSRLSLGKSQRIGNLAMTPVLGEPFSSLRYLTLDEALGQGVAHVREVSESGIVGEVLFVNESDRPVLLLDGEELVGAKQNRILNLTVLAHQRMTIRLPVSCVGAGRWHDATGAGFKSAGRCGAFTE